MGDFIQYAVLGLGIGAVYTLLAQGVVLIYRGSGVINFAHSAFAMAGAYLFFELDHHGVLVALAGAVIACTLLGALVQNTVMRPLRTAAPIVRIMATLGVFIVLQAIGVLRYADSVDTVPQFLPQGSWDVLGVAFQADRLALFGIAVAATVALLVFQHRTLLGAATSAAAENEVAAESLGWSPNMLATASWAAGGALAGVAGALIAPLTGLSVNNLSLLIVPALAAALLGGFSSFSLTLLGATGIGIAQSLSARFVTQPGASDAIPLLVIVAVLVITGRALPLRGHIFDRLPTLGSGKVRPVPVSIATVVGAFLMLSAFSIDWQIAFTTSLAVGIMLLSIVVLTGYAGQISLAQYVMAGIGAYIAGRLAATQGWGFTPALLAGVVAAVPVGLVFALPALRTRGVHLAVVTLALGLAVSRVLFENPAYTGGPQGTTVPLPTLFGIDINALTQPGRYGVVTLLLFVLTALAVTNLRRGATGRRMIAIRANERAASSLGISVTWTKMHAFAAASAIAALSGVLLAFQSTSIVYANFSPVQSIYAAAYAVIGGLGYVVGPLLGSMLAPGGVGILFNDLFSGIDEYLMLIGGLSVIAILLLHPDGIYPVVASQWRAIGRFVARRLLKRTPAARALVSYPEATRARVVPRPLEVRGLTVRFGGVVAVDDVDIDVNPGEVVGLIGPNGAGKTTLIDAVTGYVRPASGSIEIAGQDVTRSAPHARVRAGIARSWQSLELFEDVTVAENLLVAGEAPHWSRGLTDFVRPGRPSFSPAAEAAIREFRLDPYLDELPGALPYGRRRLVGIARAVALNPSVLLLDEPAAGLSSTESAELADLVRRLAASWGMGVLLIEHDTDVVFRTCDRILVLNFGRRIADGTPQDVRDDPEVVSAYLGTPA